MFDKFRIAALSALLGLGTLAAMPASAQADGFYFSFGNGGLSSHYTDRDRDRPRHYRHHRPRYVATCTPRHAVKKAYRMGLHDVRVTDVSRRTIRVTGHRYRHHASVVFARAPHCPILRTL